MMFQWTLVIALTAIAVFTPLVKALPCIGTLTELDKLQTARGNNVSTHVTYVLCPNTVYVPTDYEYLQLNGNASYLCGADGSSDNNCIIRGGSLQLSIFLFSYDRSPKDNILVSGFIFEQANEFTASVAMEGRSVFRDCIFRDNFHHSLFIFSFYLPATLRRQLTSDGAQLPSWMHQAAADHEELKKRALLIGGGSEPRVTTSFENCQFLNNSLTTNIVYPLLAQNGVVNVLSAFADVSMTNCLFRDNFYDLRRDGPGYGYMVFVESSATLNIQNSCFIDNYMESGAPVWIRATSGLIDSADNYIDDIPYGTDCQYLFNQEQYKCFAQESPYCKLPACKASYKVFNARTDLFFANIVNGGTINNPPCSINIEAILPCASKGASAKVQLLQGNTVIQELEETERFFLFGNKKTKVFPGTIASGTYKIQTKINGVVQPAPFTFTLAGTCVR